MRAADLVIGEEYHITAQQNPSPRGWPHKFNPGRVKLLEIKDGKMRCQYLENPYSSWRYYDGEGEVEVTGRSLLRPWSDVVAEEDERVEWEQASRQAHEQASKEAKQLLSDLAWMKAEITDEVEVQFDLNDCPTETSVFIEVPLSVLRGLKAHAEKHGQPQPIFPQEESSPLGELLV